MFTRLSLAAVVLGFTSAAVALGPAATPLQEAAAAADAPAVTLAPVFEQGDRFEYAFEFRSTVGRIGSEQGAALQGVTQRGTLRFNVLGVDETGAAAMTLVFSDLEIVPDAAAAEEAAAGKLAAEIATALKDVVMRVDVRADGAVSALTGLDAVHQIVGRHGRQTWPLLGPFAGEYAADSISELFRVDTRQGQAFPERTVGESWSMTEERPLAESIVLQTRTVWSLESVTDQAASLTAQVERAMGSDGAGSPAAATLTIADQSGTLTARWNVAEGRLIERRAESQLDVRASVGDLQGPIVRASTNLQVRFIEPAAAESEQAASASPAP